MEVTNPRQDPPPLHQEQQEIPQEPPQQQFVMPQQWEYQQPIVQQPQPESTFEISKQTWVMISVVFALGLFMGKSLQPIIVKSI